MSSYNSRKKEYAKKLLNNHIKDNFYNSTKPEVKYSIITKDGITDVDSKLVDYLSSETGLTRIQATDLIINEYNNFKKKYEHDRMIYNINQPTYEQKFKKYERDYKRSEFHNKNKLIMRIDQYSNYNFHESEDLGMYTEEELLEAIDILMEDYDLTEDEAIDLLIENYEDDFDDYELDELSEAVDMLMEDYDLTEDEAIDILMEDYELDELSEAVDMLMEDYDLTEDEAIDILMEEENKDTDQTPKKKGFNKTDVLLKGANLAGKATNIKNKIQSNPFGAVALASAMGTAKGAIDSKVQSLINKKGAKKEQDKKDIEFIRQMEMYKKYKKENSPYGKLKRKYRSKRSELKNKINARRKKRLKQRTRRNRVRKVKKALHLK